MLDSSGGVGGQDGSLAASSEADELTVLKPEQLEPGAPTGACDGFSSSSDSVMLTPERIHLMYSAESSSSLSAQVMVLAIARWLVGLMTSGQWMLVRRWLPRGSFFFGPRITTTIFGSRLIAGLNRGHHGPSPESHRQSEESYSQRPR